MPFYELLFTTIAATRLRRCRVISPMRQRRFHHRCRRRPARAFACLLSREIFTGAPLLRERAPEAPPEVVIFEAVARRTRRDSAPVLQQVVSTGGASAAQQTGASEQPYSAAATSSLAVSHVAAFDFRRFFSFLRGDFLDRLPSPPPTVILPRPPERRSSSSRPT